MILNDHKRLGYGLALLAIMLGAAFFRFEDLGRQAYWMDEGYTVNAVISGMQNGTKNFSEILDSGRTYFCPIYCAPTKLIVKACEVLDFASQRSNNNVHTSNAVGNDHAAVGAVPFRLLSAFAGLLVVGLFALIAKTTFKDDRIAILTAFFTAFSYWQTAWSRQARWYTLYDLFFWSALLFAYLAASKAQRAARYLSLVALALASAALATLTHSLGYGLFVVIAAYLLLSPLLDRGEGRVRPFINPKKKVMFLAVIIAAIFALEAATGFRFSRALIAKVSFHYELPYYLNFYLRNYWFLIILSLYGYFNAPKEQQKIYRLVFLPMIGYLLALGLLTDIVHYRYLFAPISGLLITGAAGAVSAVASIAKKFISRFGTTRGNILIAVCYALLAACYFFSGEGMIVPKTFYALESDSAKDLDRPYWGYTPQPNFNKAYDHIKTNLKPDDIVIASHPQFTKIFLDQPGYWIRYDYLGLDKIPDATKNNREYYVGAQTINNVQELRALMSNHHGFIVYDFMSQDGRIDTEILNYIHDNAKLVYSDIVNDYSKIWVYKF